MTAQHKRNMDLITALWNTFEVSHLRIQGCTQIAGVEKLAQ